MKLKAIHHWNLGAKIFLAEKIGLEFLQTVSIIRVGTTHINSRSSLVAIQQRLNGQRVSTVSFCLATFQGNPVELVAKGGAHGFHCLKPTLPDLALAGRQEKNGTKPNTGYCLGFL